MEEDLRQHQQNDAHQNELTRNDPDQSRSNQIERDRTGSNENNPDRSASQPITPSSDTSSDVLTIDEVQALWEEGGVYRNTTTLRKYCRLGRIEGCFKMDSQETQDKWMAPRDNAIKYMEQVKSAELLKGSQSKISPDRSEQKQTEPDRSTPNQGEDEVERIKKENSNLRIKTRQQSIDIQVKDKQIENHMRNEDRFLDRLTETSRTVGVLETKLQQHEAIEAPRSDYKVVDKKDNADTDKGQEAMFGNVQNKNSPEPHTGV